MKKTAIKNYKFKEEIYKIFPFIDYYTEYEDNGKYYVNFEAEQNFNYENLSKLSDLLGTANIQCLPNATTGGCPTCGDLTSYIEIIAMDVKINRE